MSQNHLINETSPYLLQHVDNPVQWYPWGEEALKKAAQENKPILLSIGYSACHWCHVMAHESFADEQTAQLMNDLFINIKVDREERPDIDKIYQTAQFLLTQRTGGWPLTMFLTPKDHIPFFGGTYFPNKARHGLPAFKDLLTHIASTYKEKSNDINKQNQSLLDVLSNIYQTNSHSTIEENILTAAKNQLFTTFDMQHGGFGKAPKFPHPTNIELLLRDWYRSKSTGEEDQNTLQTILLTLSKMASGGLFDHVSGGFYRYSVDDYWMIPHFEKMLYDNASLLSLYSQAYLATQEPLFKTAAIETAEWVIRDMQSPEGGYYSSLDADSEGEEGKFYIWDKDQLIAALSDKEFDLVSHRFGIDRGPNFEDKYHLHEFTKLEEYARQNNKDLSECMTLWKNARNKLYQQRSTRIAPDRDDKALTSWNALMIKAMLIASRTFNEPAFLDSASHSLMFIRKHMFINGRLLAAYKDGKAHLNAYLDDYAFLLDALLEYLQTHWQSDYLSFAIQIADVLLDQFEDKKSGGFYFTSHDHESLIQRPKVNSDEATPAGSGIAAHSLLHLGYLISEPKYIAAAERTLQCVGQQINNTPVAHASLLKCYEALQQPPDTIVIRGNQEDIKTWLDQCHAQYHPSRTIYAIPNNADNLPEALSSKCAKDDNTTAYLCRGTQCLAPFNTLDALSRELI